MESYRILVVDDEPDALELLKFHLERDDRSIEVYTDPALALKALKEKPWDLVITDIMMPGADGFSIIQEAALAEPELPCIVMTAYGTDKTLMRAIETNCFGYLNKPFDWNHLNLLVDKAGKAIRRLRRHAARQNRKPAQNI